MIHISFLNLRRFDFYQSSLPCNIFDDGDCTSIPHQRDFICFFIKKQRLSDRTNFWKYRGLDMLHFYFFNHQTYRYIIIVIFINIIIHYVTFIFKQLSCHNDIHESWTASSSLTHPLLRIVINIVSKVHTYETLILLFIDKEYLLCFQWASIVSHQIDQP